MNAIVTEHLTFDFQTQLQLDNLFDEWSRFDKVCANNGYQSDDQNERLDAMYTEYKSALDAAYLQKASREADEYIKRNKPALVALVSQWGYWQLSKQLSGVQ